MEKKRSSIIISGDTKKEELFLGVVNKHRFYSKQILSEGINVFTIPKRSGSDFRKVKRFTKGTGDTGSTGPESKKRINKLFEALGVLEPNINIDKEDSEEFDFGMPEMDFPIEGTGGTGPEDVAE